MLTFLGGGRGCAGALTRPSTRHLLPKNFEKTALRKRVGIFTVKMRGGHIYGNYCTCAAQVTRWSVGWALTAMCLAGQLIVLFLRQTPWAEKGKGRCSKRNRFLLSLLSLVHDFNQSLPQEG